MCPAVYGWCRPKPVACVKYAAKLRDSGSAVLCTKSPRRTVVPASTALLHHSMSHTTTQRVWPVHPVRDTAGYASAVYRGA